MKVVTNLFSLGLPSEWKIYQYHVAFSPELESKRLRLALLYGLAELQGKAKVFDGATLYLAYKMESQVRPSVLAEQKMQPPSSSL